VPRGCEGSNKTLLQTGTSPNRLAVSTPSDSPTLISPGGLLRRWGTTKMAENHLPLNAAQPCLGHICPGLLLKHCTHMLENSAKFAATTLGSK